MLTYAQWARLEPLIAPCRPEGKTPPQNLRRTLPAILWRSQNGAKWRPIPPDLEPWSRAAQRAFYAGRAWVSESVCWDLRRNAVSNSG